MQIDFGQVAYARAEGMANWQPTAAEKAMMAQSMQQSLPPDWAGSLALQDYKAWRGHLSATLDERFADFKTRLAGARGDHP